MRLIHIVSLTIIICQLSIIESLVFRNFVSKPLCQGTASFQTKFVDSVNNLKYARSNFGPFEAAKSSSIIKAQSSLPSFRSIYLKIASALVVFSKMIINPSIGGGLLAGSLHAVTG